MKKLKVNLDIVLILLFCSVSFAQSSPKILTPTGEESAKLGKINAQILAYQTKLELLKTQFNIVQQALAQKQSEQGGLAQQVIKDHKWTASYNAQVGEDGIFTDNEVKKEESKDKK